MFIVLLFFSLITALTHSKELENFAKQNVMDHNSATKVLDSIFYSRLSPSIITAHEWKELQLDRLITTLDRTKTSFGRWGLTQLLDPIANSDELAQRKDIIVFLVEHEKELSFLQEQLEKIHTVEKSLLAYWDKSDAIDKGAQQFYYSFPGIKENLNDSSLALNGSVLMQMFNAWSGLFMTLGLSGIKNEHYRWLMSPDPEAKYNWRRAIQEVVREPLRQHSWKLDFFKNEDESYKYTFKDTELAFLFGSWRDMYQSMSQQYGILPAFLAAGARTLFYDYSLGMSISSISTYILSMNRILNQLYDRVVDVATCFDVIKNIDRMVKKHFAIANNPYMTIAYNNQTNTLSKKLVTSRFRKKGSYFYSRGHVLSVHKEIKDEKRSLITLLRSIAFLDAFCSIAQLYKESQEQPVKFSFAEFAPSQKPFFSYTNAWLPFLSYDEAVANNLCLGRDNDCPGKIVITGPNGGGKSTILKTEGIAATLAQSWLIFPATQGVQTLFAEIKTAIATTEDSRNRLSTGEAEMKRMKELLAAIQKGDAEKRKMLVLIDEPYKGTVDEEAAIRIYEFGKNIASFSYALVAIATHVKKPITLEIDTNGLFGNYHVKIDELSSGVFKRLFKIEKGPAMWWFENADRRRRFFDWKNAEYGISD